MSCSTPSISPRRLISTATTAPPASRHSRSTGPIAVGYSRRTSDQPSPKVSTCCGQQLLQVGLDAVLQQAGVDAELVGVVVQDLLDGDDQLLAGLVGDRPGARAVGDSSLSVQGGLIQFSGL